MTVTKDKVVVSDTKLVHHDLEDYGGQKQYNIIGS